MLGTVPFSLQMECRKHPSLKKPQQKRNHSQDKLIQDSPVARDNYQCCHRVFENQSYIRTPMHEGIFQHRMKGPASRSRSCPSARASLCRKHPSTAPTGTPRTAALHTSVPQAHFVTSYFNVNYKDVYCIAGRKHLTSRFIPQCYHNSAGGHHKLNILPS